MCGIHLRYASSQQCTIRQQVENIFGSRLYSTLLAIVRCLSHTDIVLKIELVFGTETNSIIRQFYYLQK